MVDGFITGRPLHSVSLLHRHNANGPDELYDAQPSPFDPTTATHAPTAINATETTYTSGHALLCGLFESAHRRDP